MADTTDIIRKLMALALNNPSEAEAMSAALKAVQLIEKHSIPVGDTIPLKDKRWVPPEPDFMDLVNDILKGNKPNPDEQGPLVMAEDYELDDQASAFRKQIVLAWRAIREERKKIEAEWHRLKKEGYRQW